MRAKRHLERDENGLTRTHKLVLYKQVYRLEIVNGHVVEAETNDKQAKAVISEFLQDVGISADVENVLASLKKMKGGE